MATPAEKLLALSPLPSGTPAEHLCAITAGGGVDVVVTERIQAELRAQYELAASVQTPNALSASVSSVSSVVASVPPQTPLTAEVSAQQAIVASLTSGPGLAAEFDCASVRYEDPPLSGTVPGTLKLRYDADDIAPIADGAALARWPEYADAAWDLLNTGRGDPGDEVLYEATAGPNGGPCVRVPLFGWMDSADVGPGSAIDSPFIMAAVFYVSAAAGGNVTVVGGTDTQNDSVLLYTGIKAAFNNATPLEAETPYSAGNWYWMLGKGNGNDSILRTSQGTAAYGGAGTQGIEQVRIGTSSAGTQRFDGRVKLVYVWDDGTTDDEVVAYLTARFPGILPLI